MAARTRPGVSSLVTVALLLAAGCSTAASVLLDLPRTSGSGAAAAPQPAPVAAGDAPRAAVGRHRPAIEAAAGPDDALALLPRDVANGVDWMAALRQGIIDPRWAVKGDDSAAARQTGFGFDFSFKGPDAPFDARFPHSSHVQWVGCRSCHDEIFRYPDEPITMEANFNGEACGRCHGTVAFPVSTCVRCHSEMPVFSEVAEPLGTDVIMARRPAEATEGFPQARFPHWTHRIRYRCAACHPAAFKMRAGTDTLSMTAMTEGAACGACHDGRAAFALMECHRCHVAPEAETP